MTNRTLLTQEPVPEGEMSRTPYWEDPALEVLRERSIAWGKREGPASIVGIRRTMYAFDMDSPSVPLRVKLAQALGCWPKRGESEYECTCDNMLHGRYTPDGPVRQLFAYDGPEGEACIRSLIAEHRGLTFVTEVDDYVEGDERVLFRAESGKGEGLGYTRHAALISLLMSMSVDGPLFPCVMTPSRLDRVFRWTVEK